MHNYFISHFRLSSTWNEYFASAGHCVRQSALRAGHWQFVPVFCIWYTIEIWKPAGHCDRQRTNPVGHTGNRARQWPMTGGYFMHCTPAYPTCLGPQCTHIAVIVLTIQKNEKKFNKASTHLTLFALGGAQYNSIQGIVLKHKKRKNSKNYYTSLPYLS